MHNFPLYLEFAKIGSACHGSRFLFADAVFSMAMGDISIRYRRMAITATAGSLV
jgi:hypothetical protein